MFRSHNGDNGGVGCCRVQENGDAEDNRLCHRADGGGGRGGCSRGERGGGVKNCSLLPLASCDSFAQKVALDLDRSIAKHLEKRRPKSRPIQLILSKHRIRRSVNIQAAM